MPELVRDINVEIAPSHIGQLIPIEDANYFLRDHELWITDGTSDGTRVVRDVSPVRDPSIDFPTPKISQFYEDGDELYFVMESRHNTDDDFNGLQQHYDELWVTDGLKSGMGEIGNFVQAEDRLFFTNTNIVGGHWDGFESASSLWSTDGSAEGTSELILKPRT